MCHFSIALPAWEMPFQHGAYMCRNVALMWSGLTRWNSRIVLYRPVSSQAWNLTVAPLEIVLIPMSTILSGTFGHRKVTGPLVKIPKFQDSVFVVS